MQTVAKDLLAGLNNNQKKAVTKTNGKVLVLAGAGSGKTKVIVHRIAYLILEKQVLPENILGLTFTNKAAAEMRERIGLIIPKKTAKKVTLCTFHSFCMQVLKKHIALLGYSKKFTLYDERDVKRLLGKLAPEIIENESDTASMEEVIRNIQSQGVSDELILTDANWDLDHIKEIYTEFQRSMRAYNAVDFDSLISLTVKLFEEHPDILEEYQDLYQYMMIDEYQDTNTMQYKLACLLSSKYGNLFVVGDDDQSIYGWRGAKVKHILQFEADETIKLEQNYRSTPLILDVANAVIKNNKERHDKSLYSQKETKDKVFLFHTPSEDDEVDAVISRCLALKKKKNLKWSDFAILYRSNILARQFESKLIQTVWESEDGFKRGIPYQVFGGQELYNRAEIRDLMSYLRVIVNPSDQEALLRIINYPKRGISDKTLDQITQHNRKENRPLMDILEEITHGFSTLELKSHAEKQIKSFVNLMADVKEKFDTKPISYSVEYLLEKISYKKTLFEEVKSEKMKEFKWENVQECIGSIKHYEENTENASLDDFLSTTLLQQNKKDMAKRGSLSNAINLMTFHSAKGLEFPVCFLIGLEDHILPHEKSMLETSVEEERRLFYVAITRAKDILYLTMARKRKRFGKDQSSTPSRFLFEIPQDLLTLSPWKFPEY